MSAAEAGEVPTDYSWADFGRLYTELGKDMARTVSAVAPRFALRFAGCVAASSIVVAPYAAEHGVEEAQIETNIGQLDATVRFTGNEESSLRTSLGTAHIPVSQYGVGMSVEIDGVSSNARLRDVTSVESLKLYTGFFNGLESTVKGYQQDLLADAKKEAIDFNISHGLALGEGLFALSFLVQRRRFDSRKIQALSVAGAIAASTAITGFDAHNSFKEWGAEEPVAGQRYELAGLDGTIAEGAYVDNYLLQFTINSAIPKLRALNDRREEKNEAYLETMRGLLPDQLDNISAPREGEIAFVVRSDGHSNRGALEFEHEVLEAYKAAYGEDIFAFALDAGDRTQDSKTPLEERTESEVVKAYDDTPIYEIDGNHDPKDDGEKAEAAGMHRINDEVIEIEGVKVLGMNDPSYTPFLEPTINGGPEVQKELGETAREIALEEQPDVMITHEASAIKAFAGIPDINALQLNSRPQDLREYRVDSIPDIPANLLLWGHEHDEVDPVNIYNDDGTYTVAFELGTAGGAQESPYINDYSLPNAPPQKIASFVVFYMNSESGLITGYTKPRIYPGGLPEILPRIDIGTPDGQPFPIDTTFAQSIQR